MNTTKRVSILTLLIVAAIVSYVIGSREGLWLFLALGAMFEMAFWVGVFSPDKKEK